MLKKLFTATYIATLFFSCSSLRYIKKDELVLKKIKIIHQKDVDYNKIEVAKVLTQKPNKNTYKLMIYKLSPKKFRTNLLGPTVFDSILAKKSIDNISLLLKRNGFFDNQVEAKTNIKNRFVRQTFNINYGKQYKIGTVTYQLKQKNIEKIINSHKNELIIKSGHPFLFNQLKKERELITKLIKDEGFFFFKEGYVSFKLDSSKSKKSIDIICVISNPKTTNKNISQEHQKFIVKRVNIIENNNTKKLLTKNFSIFDNLNKPKYSSRLFNKSIDIRKDSIALNKDINSTYRKLYGLNIFKTVKITNKPLANNKLEVNVNLESQEKKSITTSLVGKYTGGNAGFEGGVSFNNKNLLKGAEKLTISVFGGFELQSTNTSTSSLNSFNNSIFSSFDIGPKVSLEVPLRIIPINFKKFERKYNPLSKIEASFSALARTQYERLLSTLSLNYIISPKKKNFSHIITPFNISYIKINLSEKFEKEIKRRNNPFITNSYTNHFIVSSQYQFLYRKNQRNGTNTSLRVGFESAGNLLRLIHQLTNHPLENNNYHKLFEIRYAQYIRIDAEYKYNYKNRIATRLFFGVGVPYGNLDILPFAKSFGAGGSNSMRAWNSNSLGPGGSNESDILLFNQVGDLKIEANIEYRFPIYKYLKGAIFSDIGNIWMLKPDVKRERSNIEFSRFIPDLAIGVGSGLRLDFDFFIFRLDFALPLKNPQSSNPNKLSLKLNELKINIGVGYPF